MQDVDLFLEEPKPTAACRQQQWGFLPLGGMPQGQTPLCVLKYVPHFAAILTDTCL